MKTISVRVLFTLIIFIVSGFSFLQCNSSNKTEKKEVKTSDDFFPLKDGIKWTYINEGPSDESVLITVSCSKNDGKGTYELDKYPFFGNLNNSDQKTLINLDDSDNVYIKNSSGITSVLLPNQNKWSDGYSWKYNDLLKAYLTSNYTKVKTQAGDYYCIYLTFTDGFTFSYEMWLAKGVGIVKWGANRTNPPNPHLTYYVLKELSGN